MFIAKRISYTRIFQYNFENLQVIYVIQIAYINIKYWTKVSKTQKTYIYPPQKKNQKKTNNNNFRLLLFLLSI